MSASDWLELWSGAIGAAVSAVLAALVAVFVVWRTNRHQTHLARLARDDVYTQNRLQRDQQRAGLERQLSETKEGLERQLIQQHQMLERQLADQRDQASRARQVAAVADFISFGEALMHEQDSDTTKIVNSMVAMRSAAARCRLEGPDGEALDALVGSTPFGLQQLAILRLRAKGGGDVEKAKRLGGTIATVVYGMAYFIPLWIKGDTATKARAGNKLQELANTLARAVQEAATP